jgi:arylsulfatase A-like enzyme
MDYFHHVEPPPVYEPALRLDEQPITRDGYFTELIADDAVQWLGRQNARDPAQPFFLYVPFTAPHSPFQGPGDRLPAPLPADSPLWNQGRGPRPIYAAMIESIDTAVGRILTALEERGLESDTLVVFTSDNGGTASAYPMGLRGNKGTTFEGGIRVPGIVRWPGVLPAGREYHGPALIFDLTVSMARAAGVTPPPGREFDGVDILRFVETDSAPQRAVFWRGRRGNRTWRAVRDGDLKLVSRRDGDVREDLLFDIERDPAEKNDLTAARPGDAARLERLLVAWENEVRPVR